MAKSSQKDSDKMNQVPAPIRGETGASIMGPRNVPLELKNPDQLASPYTRLPHDPESQVLLRHGAQPPHHGRLGAGGDGA